MTRFPEGLEPVSDLSPSAWVQEALKDWPTGRFHVRDLVPPVFEAYARVLHRPIHDEDGRWGTWAEASDRRGVPLGPETRWTGERVSGAGGWSLGEGSLSPPEVTTLTSFLGAHTSEAATCWFALWSGFGFLDGGATLYRSRGGLLTEWWELRRARAEDRRQRRTLSRIPTFELLGRSGRPYLLFLADLGEAERFTSSGQSPTLWWPEDRAWFVHTGIEATSTYLGGSRALVDQLVAQQVLESFEVQPDTLGRLVTNPTCWIDLTGTL